MAGSTPGIRSFTTAHEWDTFIVESKFRAGMMGGWECR